MRQGGDEFLPDPAGEILTGWIFEARNLIEIVMVEALKYWLKRYFDLSEVHNPARRVSDFAVYADPHRKRMAVQSRTFVFGGHVREPVRSLEGEFFKQSHKIGLC